MLLESSMFGNQNPQTRHCSVYHGPIFDQTIARHWCISRNKMHSSTSRHFLVIIATHFATNLSTLNFLWQRFKATLPMTSSIFQHHQVTFAVSKTQDMMAFPLVVSIIPLKFPAACSSAIVLLSCYTVHTEGSSCGIGMESSCSPHLLLCHTFAESCFST